MFEIGREYEFLTGVGETRGALDRRGARYRSPAAKSLGTRRGKDHQRRSGVVLKREAASVSLARGKEAAAKELRDLISGSDEA